MHVPDEHLLVDQVIAGLPGVDQADSCSFVYVLSALGGGESRVLLARSVSGIC